MFDPRADPTVTDPVRPVEDWTPEEIAETWRTLIVLGLCIGFLAIVTIIGVAAWVNR